MAMYFCLNSDQPAYAKADQQKLDYSGDNDINFFKESAYHDLRVIHPTRV